ncbi:hypothetical protein F5B20DRAFT_529417, partial [Whalleya microplaca]
MRRNIARIPLILPTVAVSADELRLYVEEKQAFRCNLAPEARERGTQNRHTGRLGCCVHIEVLHLRSCISVVYFLKIVSDTAESANLTELDRN